MTPPRPANDRLEEQVLKALDERAKLGRGADGNDTEPDPEPEILLKWKIWGVMGVLVAVGAVATGHATLLPVLGFGWVLSFCWWTLKVFHPALDADEDDVSREKRLRRARARKARARAEQAKARDSGHH